MEKVNKLLSDLEAEMAPKNMMPNYRWIVIIPIVAILVLFIVFTPWWAWVLYLVSLVIMANITKYNNVNKIDIIRLHYIITEFRKEISVKNQTIDESARKITDLEKKLEKTNELLEQEKLHILSLLDVLQSLDTETIDFGDECHKYVSNQIAKSFRGCGLRFQDYCEEYADCYNIEIDPKITDIEYLKKAIMDNKTNKVVLKGKVFLPQK